MLAQVNLMRVYAGFRPYCPDHLPLIGADERVPGLLHACGHEGAGIGLAPATGELIAELVTGRIDHARSRTVRALASDGCGGMSRSSSTADRSRTRAGRASAPLSSLPESEAGARTRRAGAPRGIFCGIGVCFDCLVTVDDVANERACLRPATAGTGGAHPDRDGTR